MKPIIAVVILSLSGACANYATFQEADTLPKGASKLGFGATATTYSAEDDEGVIDSVTVPAVNIWYRRGLSEKLEAHASVWIPLGSSLGVKYQLSGNREMAGLSVSLGLDLGFLQISAGDGENESTVTIVDTYVPIYIGYRTGPGFALYGTPKYILRSGFGGTDGTAYSHLVGGTAGVALGAKTTLHLEGSVFYDTDLSKPAIQGGIGIAF
jgi:hypothetical protein